MTYYYYRENDQKRGPFTIAELKPKRLKESTLVWTEGMNEWDKASNVPELQEIIFSEPPPFPAPPIIVKAPKYDPDYERPFWPISLVLLAWIFGAVYVINANVSNPEEYEEIRAKLSMAGFVLRVLAVLIAVNIAREQNRHPVGWGLFAFILPSVALSIISIKRKLFDPNQDIPESGTGDPMKPKDPTEGQKKEQTRKMTKKEAQIKLEALQDSLDAGLITEDEFMQKRQKIIKDYNSTGTSLRERQEQRRKD